MDCTDLSLVDQLPSDAQQRIRELAQSLLKEKKGNPMMCTIYRNHFEPRQDMREKIHGLVSIRALESKTYNRRVYLFGELHVFTIDINVQEWLFRYFGNADRVVDFF